MERGRGGGCFIPYYHSTFRKKSSRTEQRCGATHIAHQQQVQGPVIPHLGDPPFPPGDTIPLHAEARTCPGAQLRLPEPRPARAPAPQCFPALQVLGGFSRHEVISCLKQLTNLHRNRITLCISGRSDCSGSRLLSNTFFFSPNTKRGGRLG